MKKPENKVKGYISNVKDDYIVSSYTGEVTDKVIKWPKELGVEHPFSFEDVEGVYKKFGLLNGAINKIVNNIVGEFTIHSDKPATLKKVAEFEKKNNLRVILREWIREALVKGNGFIELDKSAGLVRVLNANSIYVVRDKKGKVLAYNQFVGDPEKFNTKKVNPFRIDQIAHLPINVISSEAYGIGIVWPNERVIENIILTTQDKRKLLSRKAGAPIHVKVGVAGEAVNPGDIDSFKTNLQYMNNRTEWVTDANVEMNVLNFGEIGKNLSDEQESLMRELIAGIDMPEVLLNSGQLNEGIAKVQIEGWKMGLQAYQDQIEPIFIEKVLKPMLGLGPEEDLDFVWNLPGESEVNARITVLNSTLSSMNLSPNLRRMLELELARLLNIQDAEEYLPQPEEGLNEQRESEDQAAKQMGNTPAPFGSKPKAPPMPRATKGARESDDLEIQEFIRKNSKGEYCVISHQTGKNFGCYPSKEEAEKRLAQIKRFKDSGETDIEEHNHEVKELDFGLFTVKSFLELKEAQGFTYSDYLVAILKRLKVDKFDDLRAVTEADKENGLLSERDINKLRTILKEGFRQNQTIAQVTKNVEEGIRIKDRIKEDGTIIAAENRPEMITRTEIVRISNESLKELYEENGVKQVLWTASMSERTCEQCMAKDGQVYDIREAVGDNIPPLHVNCRCSLIAT